MSKITSKELEGYGCIRIRSSIHKRVKEFCDKKGYKIGFFTEFCLAKNIPPKEK